MEAVAPRLSLAGHLGLDRRPAVYSAWKYITERINEGDFVPGKRLPSAATLSVTIGVSRPVILEALNIIEGQGQLRIAPGRGGVHVLTDEEAATARKSWLVENGETLVQMAHLREMIEPDIARLCAEHGLPPKVLKRANSMIRKMLRTDVHDRPQHFSLDVEFHSLLADGARMPLITDLVISARVWMSPALQIFATPERWSTSTQEHQRIVEAIKARDPEEASAASFDHLHVTTQLIRSKLDALQENAGRASLAQESKEEGPST